MELLEFLVKALLIYIMGAVVNAGVMIIALMIRIRRGDDLSDQAGAVGSALFLSVLSWIAFIFLGLPSLWSALFGKRS